MIKNIIFDMGNVLISWRGPIVMDYFGITDEKEREVLNREVFTSLEWPMLDWGLVTEEELEKVFQKRVPKEYWEHIHKILWWYDMIIPIEGMESLIRELKEKGYGIYLLSNTSKTTAKYFNRIPSSQYFDGIVLSGEEKTLKPLPEFYEILLSRYSLKAEECLFVDDLPINCASARVVGMDSIVFRESAKEVREYIEEKNRK